MSFSRRRPERVKPSTRKDTKIRKRENIFFLFHSSPVFRGEFFFARVKFFFCEIFLVRNFSWKNWEANKKRLKADDKNQKLADMRKWNFERKKNKIRKEIKKIKKFKNWKSWEIFKKKLRKKNWKIKTEKKN